MDDIDIEDVRCCVLNVSLSRGSLDVVTSLIVEEPLLLMIEALSKASRVGGCGISTDIADIPETEEAADRKPLRWESFAEKLDAGRLSGNSAFTMVNRSAGARTR